jgi:hypothetical protein
VEAADVRAEREEHEADGGEAEEEEDGRAGHRAEQGFCAA